ncbi:hypothetical protein VTK26DRAFT_613 [Humicola hyalothermophila]
MRERITFVQKLGDSLEPSAVQVNDGSITAPEIDAIREDRLTFALDELPPELQTLLKATPELHIRWVSATAYDTVSPLISRLPPGFHVFYTPGGDDAAPTTLCPNLARIFGDVSCSTPAESFTSLPRDRFSHAPALQYFQQLDSLLPFVQYAKGQLCRATDSSCSARLDNLSTASSLDISYDSASQLLRTTALWPYQRRPVHATSRSHHRTEVGILSADKPKILEPHEIGISGLLTVLGQDTKPSPTMFAFPARHRDAESSFSARFLSPSGLHPTLQLRLSSSKLSAFPSSPSSSSSSSDNDNTNSCTLHTYLTLPRTIFADKYQLSDPVFLASKNLTALRYTTQPVDLEAPAYVLPQWGSAILLDLASPPPPSARRAGAQEKEEEEEWTAEIPLHLRYLSPAPGGYGSVEVPYPAVFWACEPDDDDQLPSDRLPGGPFDRTSLGYDSLFKPGTVFWHVEPRPAVSSSSSAGNGGARLVSEVRVPVLDLERAGWVNIGTAAAVLVGFAWVAWRLAGVWWREGYGVAGGGGRGQEEKEAEEKKRQ